MLYFYDNIEEQSRKIDFERFKWLEFLDNKLCLCKFVFSISFVLILCNILIIDEQLLISCTYYLILILILTVQNCVMLNYNE